MCDLLNSVLAIAGVAIGIASLVIACVTLFRVKKIESARQEERQLFTNFLGISDVLQNLNDAVVLLKMQSSNQYIDSCITNLIHTKGRIEGSLNVLMPSDSQWQEENIEVQLRTRHYFTADFLLKEIKNSFKHFYCVGYHGQRFLSQAFIRALVRKIKNDEQYIATIIVLDCTLSSDVYETVEKLASRSRILNYAVEAKGALSEIGNIVNEERLSDSQKARLEVHCYNKAPFLHCVISDDTVYYGLSFVISTNEGPSELLENSCLVSSIHSLLGQKTMEQIEILKRLSVKQDLDSLCPQQEQQ
jgi:hypothetical protein